MRQVTIYLLFLFFKLEILLIHIKHCVYVFLCAGTHT